MKAGRHLLRSSRATSTAIPRSSPLSSRLALYTHRILLPSVSSRLSSPVSATTFSTTSIHRLQGLQPGSSEPESSNENIGSQSAAQISDAEYHEIADEYLNKLVLAVEELAEASSEGIEAEFAAGVLTVTHPKSGTYVINKQPPNKQIWLSSPISGPKRYDWVIAGSGQHEKEDSSVDPGDDGAGGRWIYLRDRSELSDLVKKELGIGLRVQSDAEEGGEMAGAGVSE